MSVFEVSGTSKALKGSEMKQLYCLVSLVLLGGNDSKDLVFFTGYEADEVTSGLEKDLPEAKDAISRSGTVSRGGKHSICHKIKNAKEYISYNAHRAESTTMYDKASRYNKGDHCRYQFSTYLPADWEVDSRESVDIFWQFKRFEGGPDIFVAVKGNDIVLRSNGLNNRRQDTLVKNYKAGRWYDFRFDILWSSGGKGQLKAFVRSGDEEEYLEVVSFSGANMQNEKSNSTYLKWGIYKPDFDLSKTKNARVIYHDEISIMKL